MSSYDLTWAAVPQVFYASIMALVFLSSILVAVRLNSAKWSAVLLTIFSVSLSVSPLYTVILSTVSLIQAWIFIGEGKKATSYRYFLYSLAFILMNIPILKENYSLCIICIFAIKGVFSSYSDEMEDGFTLMTNILMMSGLLINMQLLGSGAVAAYTLVYLSLVLSLLRSIVDSSVKTPLYVFPLLMLSSLTSGTLAILLLSIYSMAAALLYVIKDKKNDLSFLVLFAIPFIDGSVMQTSVTAISSSVVFISAQSACWLVLVLSTVSVLRLYEPALWPSLRSLRYRHIPEILLPLAVAVGASLPSYELSLPVPLVSVLALLLVEPRYLRIFSRTSMGSAISAMSKAVSSTYLITGDLTRTTYLSLRTACMNVGEITISRTRLLLWNTQTASRSSSLGTTRLSRRLTSAMAASISKTASRIKSDEMIAIVCAILALLILFLGER